MIRRVAFVKAIMAGAAGAVAWEVAARVLILLDVPLFDLVFTLGTMMLGDVGPSLWWPVGMVIHATVGAIWAIFYAYFGDLRIAPRIRTATRAAVPVDSQTVAMRT